MSLRLLLIFLSLTTTKAVHLDEEIRLSAPLNVSTLFVRSLARHLPSFYHLPILEAALGHLNVSNCTSSLVAAVVQASSSLARIAKCHLSTKNNICQSKVQNQVINRGWSLRMFDAWGRPRAGLLSSGQMLWYGDYDQCVTQHSQHCLIRTATLEQAMQNQETPIIQFGICLPVQCSSENVQKMLNQSMALLSSSSASLAFLDQMKVKVHCSNEWSFWDERKGAKVVVICVLLLLVSLVVAGTIADYVRIKFSVTFSKRKYRTAPSSGFRTLDHQSQLTYKNVPALKVMFQSRRWWLRSLVAFSARFNLASIFRLDKSSKIGRERRIACLDGLRFWMTVWVITGHTYLFALPFVSNLAPVADRLRRSFVSQLLLNCSLAVDSFFLMSGLLTTYLWARKTTQNPSLCRPTRWILFYVHRLVRLLPSYALVFSFSFTIFPYLGAGPTWHPSALFGVQCDKNDWWKHLLFVSNYFPTQCLPWMWYLALDTQFYLLAPLLLCLLCHKPKCAQVLAVALVLLSAILRGAITVDNRYPPNLMLLLPQENFNITSVRQVFQTVYAMPYTRIGPYLVGMLLGWQLAGRVSKPYELGTRRVIFYWIVALSVGCWCLFGAFPFYNGFNYQVYIFLFSSSVRTAWATAWALVIFLCHSQKGGLFGSFLGSNCWRPLSRLSYGAYLCHELILVAYLYTLRQPIYFEGHFQMMITVIGLVFVSFCTAFVPALLAEYPPQALERLLFKEHLKRVKPTKRRRSRLPHICPKKRTECWVQEPKTKLSQVAVTVESEQEDELSTALTSTASNFTQIASKTLLTTQYTSISMTSSRYYDSELNCVTATSSNSTALSSQSTANCKF